MTKSADLYRPGPGCSVVLCLDRFMSRIAFFTLAPHVHSQTDSRPFDHYSPASGSYYGAGPCALLPSFFLGLLIRLFFPFHPSGIPPPFSLPFFFPLSIPPYSTGSSARPLTVAQHLPFPLKPPPCLVGACSQVSATSFPNSKSSFRTPTSKLDNRIYLFSPSVFFSFSTRVYRFSPSVDRFRLGAKP